jgi:HD-GYP domain-containing protein (c-di-GMP phosphodiesterase class II)
MFRDCVDMATEKAVLRIPDSEQVERSAIIFAGRSLINQITAIQKLLRIYKPDNATVLQAGDSLILILGTLFEDLPNLEIRFWRDCIFVNGDRLRSDISNFSAYKHLLSQTRRLEIEKIVIEKGIARAEVIRFFCLIDTIESEGVKGQELQRRISSAGFDYVKVTPSSQSTQQLDDLGIKTLTRHERAKRAFYAALGSAKEVLLFQKTQGAINLRKAKRAVQAAVDSLLDDESSILALAAIKDHDEYTFTHSVNVCIFSLAIGHRLGLHRSWLGRLGIASLFHDIGKVSIPTDVLNKVGMLDVNEWSAIRDHTVMGVRKLSRLPRCNEHVLHSVIVAFQHHINMDLSGYPDVPLDCSLDLFSRIVRIADTFDAMTTERPYRNKVYSPHEAIRYLVAQSGTKFDPVLVKAFANAVGIFPIGTVLRLNTGEVGIVVRRSQLSSEVDRSVVKILIGRAGNAPKQDTFIDLGEVDPETGQFIHSVIDTLSCKDFGVNPSEHLLG